MPKVPEKIDMKFVQAELKKAHTLEIKECARNFWYYAQFLVTQDEERQINRPYPLNFKYLHDYDHATMVHRKVAALKPRRMLISLQSLAKKMWKAHFAGTGLPGSMDVYHGGYSATDEDLAFYQMGRINFMYDHLPLWLQDFNPMTTRNALFKEFRAGGKIQGFPLKRQGPQGFGFSDFTFDEMAWQEAARTTWKGLVPTIGVGNIEAISTPNGKDGMGRLFWEIWTNDDDDYKDIHRWTCDWWDNPDHDESWYKNITSGLKKWEIAQMLEKSFISMAGKPIWQEFERRFHVADIKKEPLLIIPSLPMFVGWDLGFLAPVVMFAQMNPQDQWVLHREFRDYEVSFGKFCRDALVFANTFYNRKEIPEIICVPPDAKNRYRNKAESGAINDIAEIKMQWRKPDGTDPNVRWGAMQTGTRQNEGPRLKEVRKLWSLRGDGNYGIIINPQCETFIDGCGGGYYRDEKGGEEPVKNSYSDPQDAFQMDVTAYNRMVDPTLGFSKKKKERPPDRIGMGTGM